MIECRTTLGATPALAEIRADIYHRRGYWVAEQFLPRDGARALARRWFAGDYAFQFADAMRNTEVRHGSPNYLIRRPTENDLAFCCHVWAPPADEETHAAVLEAQLLRNLVEGRPLHYATRPFDPQVLQYRLCRTLSEGSVVKPHADFMEEPRHDPTGDHAFDPRRCQLTLILSDHGTDYEGGGFWLTGNDGERRLVGRDIPARAGDLVIWKYSNTHEVSGVRALDPALGFARVIVPLFDGRRADENA